MKYIKSVNEFQKLPYLCDIDMDSLLKTYNTDIYGPFDIRIERESFDINLSKSLCLDGKTIGYYLLGNAQLVEDGIELFQYWFDETNNGDNEYPVKNLKLLIDEATIIAYKGKKGIFSDFLWIAPEHRNKNYGKILIDYSLSLGDYVWGISNIGNGSNKFELIKTALADKYWLNYRNRISILEYDDTEHKFLVSDTKLNN